MKRLTRAQVESRKEKAVRFTDNVLGDSERAEEIADESVEDYAERRGIEITSNPARRKRRFAAMARATGKTKAELEQELDDLKQENEDLQDQLDAVADIVAPADDEDEETEDDEEDEAQD